MAGVVLEFYTFLESYWVSVNSNAAVVLANCQVVFAFAFVKAVDKTAIDYLCPKWFGVPAEPALRCPFGIDTVSESLATVHVPV